MKPWPLLLLLATGTALGAEPRDVGGVRLCVPSGYLVHHVNAVGGSDALMVEFPASGVAKELPAYRADVQDARLGTLQYRQDLVVSIERQRGLEGMLRRIVDREAPYAKAYAEPDPVTGLQRLYPDGTPASWLLLEGGWHSAAAEAYWGRCSEDVLTQSYQCLRELPADGLRLVYKLHAANLPLWSDLDRYVLGYFRQWRCDR